MSASTKKYAQSLETGHPACADACQRLTSLFYNSGGDRLTLVMTGDALDLLVGLAPHEPAARHTLAAAASASWRARAYPEARACIDALLPFEAEAPWARTQFRIPWAGQAKFYAALQDPTHTRDFTARRSMRPRVGAIVATLGVLGSLLVVGALQAV